MVVDEVQRLPDVLHEVHRVLDQKRARFALTGSSARKFRRAGVNLLGGRAQLRSMLPFVPEEDEDTFSLERALRYGTLPSMHEVDDPDEALQAYVDVYLREEVSASCG